MNSDEWQRIKEFRPEQGWRDEGLRDIQESAKMTCDLRYHQFCCPGLSWGMCC